MKYSQALLQDSYSASGLTARPSVARYASRRYWTLRRAAKKGRPRSDPARVACAGGWQRGEALCSMPEGRAGILKSPPGPDSAYDDRRGAAASRQRCASVSRGPA